MSGDETLIGEPDTGTPPVSAARPRGIGRGDSIGRYLVLRTIGTGTTGTVYAAWDPEVDRRLALKLLHPPGILASDASGEHERVRLLAEARALARLHHPNVIALHDVGEYDGRVFLAMEFVDGETLATWRARLLPSWRRILAAYLQAARGLAAIHAAGIVHRDFKPRNALIDASGAVRVVDFGLARPAGAVVSTRELQAGTPAYMAAELHTDRKVDLAADQFAFCVALYEALYDQHPFGGDSPIQVAAAVLRGEMSRPPRGTAVPRAIARVLERGLARDPTARWPSVDALVAALERAAETSRRAWWFVGAAAVAIAAVAAWRLTSERAPACRGADDALAQAWGDEQRADLQALVTRPGAIAGPDTATIAARGLDTWIAAARETAVASCEARAAAPESSARIDACLALHRLALDATLARWRTGDANVASHVIASIDALGDPRACAQVSAPLVATPPVEPSALTRTLVEAWVDAATGGCAEAQREGERALALASREGREIVPLAERVLARCAIEAQDLQRAETELSREYFAAIATGRDDLAGEAASELVEVVGLGRMDLRAALAWAEHADALAERRDHSDGRGAATLARARVLARHHRFEDALGQYVRAIAVLGEVWSPDDPRLLRARAERALAQTLVGRHDLAAVEITESVTALRRILGDTHPTTLAAIVLQAEVELRAGDPEQARRELEPVVTIATAAHDDGTAYDALVGLGHALLDLDRPMLAERRFAEAIEVGEVRFGGGHPRLAVALTGLSEAILRQGGAPPRAAIAAERALALLAAIDDPIALGEAQVTTARCLLAADPHDLRGLELASLGRSALRENANANTLLTLLDGSLRARSSASPELPRVPATAKSTIRSPSAATSGVPARPHAATTSGAERN